LHGFYIRGRSKTRRHPLLILNNGSDRSLLDMWLWGGAGATARGYDCLTFDGPGQGYALWKQKLYFRPDWEKVITPVVDFALSRADVDPKRIAIQGISQGGYWIPRAVAFEKRVAAAIADPGVVDVSTSWIGTLPKPLLELLRAGRKTENCVCRNHLAWDKVLPDIEVFKWSLGLSSPEAVARYFHFAEAIRFFPNALGLAFSKVGFIEVGTRSAPFF